MTESNKTELLPCKSTDKELWREREGDYYSPSIHVTESGGIGINVGGTVIVRPLREWHRLANIPQLCASDVERVAVAIAKAEYQNFNEVDNIVRKVYIRMAEAAIQAM